MRGSLTTAALLLLLIGCAESFRIGEDLDGGTDAFDPSCTYVGRQQLCDEACPRCRLDRHDCQEWRREPDRTPPLCVTDTGNAGYPLCRGAANDESFVALNEYCFDGSLCMDANDERVREHSVSGNCVDLAACEWLRDREEYAQCRYSDGSFFVDGPPSLDECPELRDRAYFCGGPCGGCADYPDPGGGTPLPSSCLGLSESRGYGACAHSNNLATFDFVCFEGGGGWQAVTDIWELRGAEAEATCFVTRDPESGAMPTRGLFMFRDVCLRYRQDFPDSTDCMTEAWRSDPG